MKIKFTNSLQNSAISHPIPAHKMLPEWYKKQESYLGNKKKPDGNAKTTATIKRCLPVFDSITAGYLILLPADVYVSQREGLPYFEWADFNLITFHPVEQATNHPQRNSAAAYPKWMNPWIVQTPNNYSSWFTQPKHRDLPFTILDGFVDTDTYKAAVNFPFVLKDPSFEGLIPAGTPIAQVIPIKRESWTFEIGNQKDLENYKIVTEKLSTRFFDAYKNFFWSKKSYF